MPEAESTPALAFRDVGMTFPDGTHAVRDTTFDIRRGEFVTIVGPSGCGKSTLLKIAAGLLAQSHGEVSVDRRRIGYVFQDPTLLPWRTVQGNVELLPQLHDVPPAERKRLASEAIAKVGLAGFEHHYPKTLSGGMKMRCSLARSLTLRPPLFLFDEPFGAVDEITRERLNDETQTLFQSEQFAGLFITHSISEAVYMSTRVLVMSFRPGTIIADFPIPFEHPRTPELRFEGTFTRLCSEIADRLRAGSGGQAE